MTVQKQWGCFSNNKIQANPIYHASPSRIQAPPNTPVEAHERIAVAQVVTQVYKTYNSKREQCQEQVKEEGKEIKFLVWDNFGIPTDVLFPGNWKQVYTYVKMQCLELSL